MSTVCMIMIWSNWTFSSSWNLILSEDSNSTSDDENNENNEQLTPWHLTQWICSVLSDMWHLNLNCLCIMHVLKNEKGCLLMLLSYSFGKQYWHLHLDDIMFYIYYIYIYIYCISIPPKPMDAASFTAKRRDSVQSPQT